MYIHIVYSKSSQVVVSNFSGALARQPDLAEPCQEMQESYLQPPKPSFCRFPVILGLEVPGPQEYAKYLPKTSRKKATICQSICRVCMTPVAIMLQA